jgi:hypothetical protein
LDFLSIFRANGKTKPKKAQEKEEMSELVEKMVLLEEYNMIGGMLHCSK